MIICNGPPKSGTGLLLKCMALMGYEQQSSGIVHFRSDNVLKWKRCKPNAHDDVFVHAHVWPTNEDNFSRDNRVITILRNPRNTMLSWLRDFGSGDMRELRGWRDDEEHLIKLIEGTNLSSQDSAVPRDVPYPWFFSRFLGWDFLVFFEDIFSDEGKTIKRIARKIKWVGDPRKIYDNLYGGVEYPGNQEGVESVSTWTGKHVNWRDRWTPKVDKAWKRAGGYLLDEKYEEIRMQSK